MKWLVLSLIFLLISSPLIAADSNGFCAPTRPDADGPFYREGAPVRNRVGSGYLLSGLVLSTNGCKPLPGAKIEIWLNGPDGRYGDAWRATLYADHSGRYRFESHVPVPYGSRPPHIHIIVNAAGHRELITQHYPVAGQKKAAFDLVLIAE